MAVASVVSASGFGGLENSPLARIGYHNKIIAEGWTKEFLPHITNTSIDNRVVACNQMVQFTRAPSVGDWKPYEKNQELVPDYISPEAFCLRVCNAAYKSFKFDKLDISRICDRWAPFEEAFLKATYERLAETWRSYVLNAMVLEADPKNKGKRAGCNKQLNLGAANAPIKITAENFARELAKVRRALIDSRRWVENEMFVMIPSALWEVLVDTPYVNQSIIGGNCAGGDCSLLVTGLIPNKMLGFNVFVVDCLPQVIDEGTGALSYYIIAGHKEAYGFVGDIIEGEIVRPPRYFGIEYQMLAVWGGKAIYPDALAVAYWTF